MVVWPYEVLPIYVKGREELPDLVFEEKQGRGRVFLWGLHFIGAAAREESAEKEKGNQRLWALRKSRCNESRDHIFVPPKGSPKRPSQPERILSRSAPHCHRILESQGSIRGPAPGTGHL